MNSNQYILLEKLIMDDAKTVMEDVNFDDLGGKNILITGASGLLGVCFLACLKEIKSKLSIPLSATAVIRSDPTPIFREIFNNSDIEVHQGDLTEPSFRNDLSSFDYIIHAACYGPPRRFMQDTVKTLKLNTSVTFALLEKLNPQGKFLFLSSSEVYSGLNTYPHRESEIGATNTDHPRSCYIEGKRSGEAICHAYREKDGIQAKSARLCLAYGPGTKEGDKRVICELIYKALKNRAIGLTDQGRAMRTYCYLTDAIELLWKILLFGNNRVYNVGGQSRVSIAELATQIGDILNVPVRFPSESDELRGAPSDVWLDMKNTVDELGKSSYVDLTRGLERTINWHKALYST